MEDWINTSSAYQKKWFFVEGQQFAGLCRKLEMVLA
jgi:hypothetical protein